MKNGFLKKSISLIIVTVLLTAVLATCLVACDTTDDKQEELELNIIDDNYRNWYEIFVYSFFDSNDDGIGDLNGVTQKLDYLSDLGVNGIWLMPIHPSPTYHKYDVKDYYDIDSDYGTLDDFDKLIEEAHNRGIKVIIDLVFNHTSSSHPWFTKACNAVRSGDLDNKYVKYYNFTKDNQAGYTQLSGTSYYYESRFWSGMPDLNLDNEDVRAEMKDIIDYWLTTHNVDGFRLDAVTSYYTKNVAKNVEFLNWLNVEAKQIKSDCYIVGEAWEGSDGQINDYYQSGCDSFFLFTGAQGGGELAGCVKRQDAQGYASWVKRLENVYTKGVLAPFLGNHDTMRPGSFMPDTLAVKMAGGLLSMMNGSMFMYYGEEIGMISLGGTDSDPHKRIAMLWESGVYKGWCYQPPEGITVNKNSYKYPSVKEQQEDDNSIYAYYKQALKLRNCFPQIARGTIEVLELDNDAMEVCAIKKTYNGESITIVINLSRVEDQTVNMSGALKATLLADNSTGVKYDSKHGTITLPPCSIAIFQ